MISAVRICLFLGSAAMVRGATVQILSAVRQVSSAGNVQSPSSPLAWFAAEVVSPAGPDDSFAAQTSNIGPGVVTLNSRVTGGPGLGMSVLILSFRLTESAAWSADGSFSLLGQSGFACVSLVNVPLRSSLLLNEVAGDPPAAVLARTWATSGILAPGDYELEAIIHTGGTGPFHTGSMELCFTVPEPGSFPLTIAGFGFGFALRRRSRQGCARTLVN